MYYAFMMYTYYKRTLMLSGFALARWCLKKVFRPNQWCFKMKLSTEYFFDTWDLYIVLHTGCIDDTLCFYIYSLFYHLVLFWICKLILLLIFFMVWKYYYDYFDDVTEYPEKDMWMYCIINCIFLLESYWLNYRRDSIKFSVHFSVLVYF